MSNNRLYLDIHAIQAFPPSCVNRDDTGAPKSCIYGGKMRARISSQCWKKAMRTFFTEHAADMSTEMCGVRTRKIVAEVAKILNDKYGFTREEAALAAAEAARIAGITGDEGAKETIAFFSHAQIKAFAAAINDFNGEIITLTGKGGTKEKKGKPSKEFTAALKKAIMDAPSADILLFGRMFASAPSLEYDAASQVAHAISVNEVRTEYDYFSAVDDIPDADHNGAAHIDTKCFNDPVFYRYATVNLSDTSELVKYAGENIEEIAKAFVEAFVLAMPTGSRNSFANNTVPDAVMITLREDRPISFAPAFRTVTKGEDFVQEAEDKMNDYAENINSKFGSPVFMVDLGKNSFNEMIDAVIAEIKERI